MERSGGRGGSLTRPRLTVELKNDADTVLASGTIAPSTRCLSESQNDTFAEKYCHEWGYTEFGTTIELALGQTYSLELSASSGAGFRVPTFNPLSSHGFTDRNFWDEARAEVSTNSGSS